MTEFFDTSPIPDNPEHWEQFGARVAATAGRFPVSGLGRMTEAPASWIAATLLLAAALAFAILPRNNSIQLGAEWWRSLAPPDGVGRALTSGESPPAIGALLLTGQGGG